MALCNSAAQRHLYEVFTMANRINLSVEDDLFKLLKEDADKHNCPINVYLISMLEQIYLQNPFDYPAALEVIEKEAKEQPVGKDFTLVELPSFSEICIVRAENAQLKPSVVRARLGKMFNSRVREGAVGDVSRSMEANGSLKFISRAAVYCRKPVSAKDCFSNQQNN